MHIDQVSVSSLGGIVAAHASWNIVRILGRATRDVLMFTRQNNETLVCKAEGSKHRFSSPTVPEVFVLEAIVRDAFKDFLERRRAGYELCH